MDLETGSHPCLLLELRPPGSEKLTGSRGLGACLGILLGNSGVRWTQCVGPGTPTLEKGKEVWKQNQQVAGEMVWEPPSPLQSIMTTLLSPFC